ncbi:hypothetical protein GTU99_03170 [Streptomyces sp. PRKS01-65]|nr:hypothetical protein [Streptomyces harenosi]NEY31216.1 hypothetical protein [Streptomyces harenosi]
MSVGEGGGTATSGAAHVPYATDGTDFSGALKYHYGVVLKRFLRFGLPSAALFGQMYLWPMEHRGYVLPVALAGLLGLVFTSVLCYARVSLLRSCSRVFRTYPLVFRGPLEKVRLESRKLHIRLGERVEPSMTMLAKDPLGRPGWPGGMSDGLWFAGDDPFGGAAIVPGTGEVLFMQPRDWAAAAKERQSAGEARAERARGAGLTKAVGH